MNSKKNKAKMQRDKEANRVISVQFEESAAVSAGCSGTVDTVNPVSPSVSATVNELLTYAIFYRDRATLAAIIRVLTNFF